MKSVAIYCASKLGNKEVYAQQAKNLAQYLFSKNIDIVYGGAKVGIMGIVAEETMKLGGNVYGVMPQFLVDKEVANPNITNLVITQTMSERKYKMMELAEGFIALPGGFGTFEEIFEVLTLAQVKQLHKPIGFLNIDNYYTPLLTFLKGCVDTGLLALEHFDIIHIHEDYEILLDQMQEYYKEKV